MKGRRSQQGAQIVGLGGTVWGKKYVQEFGKVLQIFAKCFYLNLFLEMQETEENELPMQEG